MFTVRQFEETRVILKDESQILARLMRSETKHFSTSDLSPAMIDRLARDVLFDRTSMLLVSTDGAFVYSDEFLQPQPRVDYTVEVLTDYGTLGSLTLTRSIRERLPIMISVVAGRCLLPLLAYTYCTRVFSLAGFGPKKPSSYQKSAFRISRRFPLTGFGNWIATCV